MHPLIPRIFASILAVFLLVGSMIIGAVAFIALLGFMIIAWAAFALRMWWLRRKYHQAARRGQGGARTVEGDYRVMHDRDRRDP